jgi:hypothetical protein
MMAGSKALEVREARIAVSPREKRVEASGAG